MAGNFKFDIQKPQTQTVDAIKALLSWRGRASDPLPSFIEMGEGEARLILVLSNKRDAYYTVTGKTCSCPARGWHPNQPCKHQRKYFPEVKATTKATDSIMPKCKSFKPFLEDTVRPARASSSFELVDCLPDPTSRDLAYHSIMNDREMWPAEA